MFRAIVLCLTLVLVCPVAALARPVEAVLFPQGAKVTEQETLNVQDAQRGLAAVFSLPVQADPDTMTLAVTDGAYQVLDVAWDRVAMRDEDKIAALRQQLEDMMVKRSGISARITALDAQIGFWTTAKKGEDLSAQQALALSEAMGRAIEDAGSRKSAAQRELEEIEKQIKQIEEQLRRAAGAAEQQWRVTVNLSGTGPGSVTLKYAYYMDGCGWSPAYRLNARPKEALVEFNWDAWAWQSSGRDWTGVDLSLATLRPRSVIEPPRIPDWIIRPMPEVLYETRADLERKKSAPRVMEAEEMVGAAAPAPEPVEEKQSTFSLWRLGRRDLPAGDEQRIKVQSLEFKAEFTHLARPSRTEQTFIRADLKLPEARNIPSGEAVYMIDGQVLGKRSFSLAGDEKAVYFGADPLVSAVSELKVKKAGEAGIISSRRTRVWEWEVKVKNSHEYPVQVRLEEPKPVSRHEDIELKIKHRPEPDGEEKNLYVWKLQLAPGGEETLTFRVEMKAPEDMDVDFGWR